MLAVLSNGDAAVIVALIGAVVTVLGARTRREIKQINRAVNHQAEDQPTLVQRVIRLEDNQEIHTAWTAAAFGALAKQIGVTLPERPASIIDYEALPTHRKKASP